MIAAVGTAFDTGIVYEQIARIAGAIAVWAAMRAERRVQTPDDAYRDLELRLRHPFKYRIQQVTRLFR